ncbi:uncharacterized protein LOC126661555 [Mercurialis annua]|uniref:uncharacterized protein LOC126661555 n=1 Tax=Mercurialis annua TaxID=3986 RepID=UPI0024AF4E94|nr:uncharacterized protein LOC126661555 [Mercurialis annua]
MATSTLFVFAFVMLFLATQGNCQCDAVSQFKFIQIPTGQKIQNKPEWNITVTNDCLCTRDYIKLDCNGFQTVEKVDPLKLVITGTEGLLNNGDVVRGYESVSFTYAWDSPFQFKVISSLIGCS